MCVFKISDVQKVYCPWNHQCPKVSIHIVEENKSAIFVYILSYKNKVVGG